MYSRTAYGGNCAFRTTLTLQRRLVLQTASDNRSSTGGRPQTMSTPLRHDVSTIATGGNKLLFDDPTGFVEYTAEYMARSF